MNGPHGRLITIDTAYNVRHIGGYPTADGRVTRDEIVRAASLGRVTPEGLAALAGLGIRTVMDFRSSGERERDKTPELEPHGIAHIVAPVFEGEAGPDGTPEKFRGFPLMYQDFLDNGGPAYRALGEAIAGSAGGFLYHCAVGKDRTGVATMLLLELAGVPDELILEDYSHSAELLQPVFERWTEYLVKNNQDPEAVKPQQTSNPADIAHTLAHLRDRWGSASNYFRAAGVEAETVSAVRARLIE